MFSLLVLLLSNATIHTATTVAPKTPINHIVILMQENHSFDQYFGTFPGLAPGFGIDPTVCEPYNITNPSQGCVHPFNADAISSTIQNNGLGHSTKVSRRAYDNGKMDGFVYAQLLEGRPDPNFAMAYFTNHTIPNYWNLASYFTLDANFFSSILSYSYPNHLYAVAGQVQNTGPKYPVSYNLAYAQMASELTNAGIDWKYFTQDWSDTNQCKQISSTTTGAGNPFWNVLIDFPAIQLGSACHNIQNRVDLVNGLRNGYLPQVAWVEPGKNDSDHPQSSTLLKSMEYSASVIDLIESNPTLWSNTLIVLTWDDFGGYYDNIVPNQVDAFGYGFRAPTILISPFARQGMIYYGQQNKQEDFSALLSTIEYNWNLAPLTQRDTLDAPLFNALNFTQAPLKPLILPTNTVSVYPWQSCVSKGLCRIGSGGAVNLPSWLLSSDTSLSPTNEEGDPYD